MSAIDEILNTLPIDQLAAQLGADPTQVQAAAATVLPALLGGLQANAADPAGAASLGQAVQQHSGDLSVADPDDSTIDLQRVDVADGAKISRHIFGANEEAVVQRLGSTGSASSALISKLIPILAPIVLAYLAKRLAGGAAGAGTGGAAVGPASGSGGLIGEILSQVLAGAAQGAGSSSSAGKDAGSIIGDVLGGLLGGGRR